MIGRSGAGGALWLVSASVVTAYAATPSQPVDCFPDRLVSWNAAQPNPDARFGAANLPGIVIGPPGDSAATVGATTVASLGNGGSATLAFDEIEIEDRPGADFILFENAFFVGSVPADDNANYTVFDEPGIVEVSADGVNWRRFPFDAAALDQARGHNADRALQHRLRGLAGITPTFTGNWTLPDDLGLWDPSGQGGVSGAGGDAFDLATVGLTSARFVRVIDAGAANGPPGSAEGFDLDSIVVLHGRPLGAGVDSDGDGLSDDAERLLYGTDPHRADSDGDGTDDGREVAGCRDPNSFSTSPWWIKDPHLWVRPGSCTELRWSFAGSGATYDLLHGKVSMLSGNAAGTSLNGAVCVADNSSAVRYSCDATAVPANDALYWLVRVSTSTHYGWSSVPAPRTASGACP